MNSVFRYLLPVALAATVHAGVFPQEKKPLTVTDMMKFRQLVSPSVSRDGRWVVLTASPDRGDPEVQVVAAGGKSMHTIPYADRPVFSDDGNWVAAREVVSLEEQLKSMKGKDRENGPKPGLVLLNNSSGEEQFFERIESFEFSHDNRWILFRKFPADARDKHGTDLVLKSLGDTLSFTFPFVTTFAVDSTSRYLAYAVNDTAGTGNGVFVTDLRHPDGEPAVAYADSGSWADFLTWDDPDGRLAFLAGMPVGKENRREKASLYLWKKGSGDTGPALEDTLLEEGWHIYHTNRLRWSQDGQRLFLGLKPDREIIPEEEEDTLFDIYDTGKILAERGVDVWKWDDPYIIPQQKIRWKEEKDRTYAAVFYPDQGRLVPLAVEDVPSVRFGENDKRLLAYSNVPYARQTTWDDRYLDYYLVDLASGLRTRVLEKQEHDVLLSPDGKFLVFYRKGNWHLMDATTLEIRNLTGGLEVSFADEDWDYPADVPGYGVAGWLDRSQAVLIYDKFDIWQFSTADSHAICLTGGEGRRNLYRFRIHTFDPEKKYLEKGEQTFLTATHDSLKNTALFEMKAGEPGVRMVMDGPFRYTPVAKAGEKDVFLYSRESYREFPDLWITGAKFRKPEKLTDLNPQVSEFAWGNARLVEWTSLDGKPLQGVLITPDDYQPGERLPVLVYYYRFFSDRLYEFNEVVVNHRPCFPYYVSNGYAMFLPDIRFDVGNPGYSATRCLVPGVQKIIDMGIADPDAICLHGHSWSGYQTAFVITQTDIFACAIAGAPVSNMTSAYSGIRWESGIARQSQYEKTQSRIGGSLWEERDRYIENSPVFYADRIHTPLLIEFGDNDGAVPWYQGIELYLAMRRLGKDCIFLEYRDESHHLKKYENKLDYTLKFRQYLDHYLKGEPAADWIRDGVPYQGK